VLFLAEFIVGGLVYNVCNALQVAKDHNFDIQGDVGKASRSVRNFLHDQLDDFYDHQDCQGGAANSSSIPIGFAKITCKSSSSVDVINAVFKDQVINDATALNTYNLCTLDTAYTPSGEKPSDFTEAFCGSQSNIVNLAQKYSNYLMWFPVGLGVLTLVLLIATICMISQKNRQRVEILQGRQALTAGHTQFAAQQRR
jgi:hypothetical protein